MKKRKWILWLDCETDWRGTYIRKLEKLGFDVEVYHKPKQALSRLTEAINEQDLPSVILTEFFIQRRRPRIFLSFIDDMVSSGIVIPVICITSCLSDKLEPQLKEFRCLSLNLLFPKPPKPKKLFRAIEKVQQS